MNQEFLNIILTGLSIIVTGLCSWATAALIAFLNAKIKDKKLATFLTKITIIVTDAVQAIQQDFVETLKEQGRFDAEAQRIAKERAMAIILGQLSDDMRTFIDENFGEIEDWISERIESAIYSMKIKKGQGNV